MLTQVCGKLFDNTDEGTKQHLISQERIRFFTVNSCAGTPQLLMSWSGS